MILGVGEISQEGVGDFWFPVWLAGANDFGGTLINESISTSAGAQHGQLMKPKQIHSIIRSSGRIPAQRSTTYKLIKVYGTEKAEGETELDKADPAQFGSYHALIKLDKFRYRGQGKATQPPTSSKSW